MKKLIIFIALVYAISCKTMCDGTVPEDDQKCTDFEKADPDKDYCCYYTGNDVETVIQKKFVGNSLKLILTMAKSKVL